MIIIKRVLSLALFLSVFLGTRANNKVTISSAEGSPGEEVTISVGLENTDAISSFQVIIPIDNNVTLVEESATVGSRCSGHSVVAGVKNDHISILVYSLSMAPITGTSGEVVSFKLKLGTNPQTTDLIPSQVVVTNPSGEAVSCICDPGTVTAKSAKAVLSTLEVDYGSVPIKSKYIESVNVTNEGNDELIISRLDFSDPTIFSSTMTLPKSLAPGESQTIDIVYNPVVRGSISKNMKVISNSISKLNTVTLKAQPYAVNEIHVNPISGNSDEEVTVTVRMNNMDDISGLQLEFAMPDALKYIDGSFVLSSRKEDHVIVTSINDGILRALAYSPTDKPFKNDDGEICSFKVILNGSYSPALTPSNVVLSATINNKVENVVSAFTGATVSINSPSISINDRLDFGAISVMAKAEKTIDIRNNGSAQLIINKVVADNYLLSIKEELPLSIQPGQKETLTAVYQGTEQTDFNGTLSIYSNDPEKRLCNVAVSGSRFAPNYVSLTCNNIYPQEDLVVNVNFDTYDDINGLQFDLEYPSQYFAPFDNNIQISDKATGMTVTTRDIGEGVIRYFCYFIGGGNIQHGSGKIMSITLKCTNNEIPHSTHTVKVTNIIMSTSELTDKYAGKDTSVDFIVKTPNPVTITAKNESREYGDNNPDFSYMSSGAEVEGVPIFSCDATKTSPVGTYTIVISKGSVTNDFATFVNGTLTVTKAPLTISAGTYNITDGEDIPDFNATFGGFKNDETKTVLKTQPIFTCSATKDSGPGEYDIIISGATADNYDITHVNGKLVIVERLCESISLSPTSQTLKPGDKITITASVMPENATSRSITWSSSNESVAKVDEGVVTAISPGTANITATTVDGSNISATCMVTVKAPVTITAKNESREYGDNNPDFSYMSSGAEVEGVPIFSCDATKTSPVGTYTIVISKGSVTNDFATFVNGTLTVTKAPLTISAGTYNITDGEDIPDFNATFGGFKNDETKTVLKTQPIFTCSATKDSGPGEYDIIISGATADNYDITHVNGKLVIVERLCESISLSPTSQTLKPGDKITITASVMPENATSRSITWSSSNESVAKVDEGVVTAISPGTANITATTVDGSNISATCVITVVLSNGIININYDNINNEVYLLNGFKVGRNIDTKKLPDGIYIINGKKVVISSKY